MPAFAYTRPPLSAKQREAFFNDCRYSMIEGSTKSGKTVGSMAWLLEQALKGKAGDNYLWVAPVYAQAKIAFRRYKLGLPKDIFTPNASDLFITLANGATIWFKGGDNPDSIYGEDYRAVVVDEASRTSDALWAAVRSTTTATSGPIRAIGNVRGRGNWHYKLCRKAEAGEPNYFYAKIVANDAVEAGIIPASEIDDARRALPDHVFRELYLCEPSDDGNNPFGLASIRKCIVPISQRPPKNWGVDLAKSVDWTVAIGLDDQGHTSRFERFQSPWLHTIKVLRETISDNEPCLYDSTGVGDPVGEQLSLGRSNFEGFKFTSASKQQLMEGLAVAIQSGEVGYPEGIIVAELEQFEYEYTRTGVRYSAPEGFHDDTVCALALAVRRKTIPIEASGFLDHWDNLVTN